MWLPDRVRVQSGQVFPFSRENQKPRFLCGITVFQYDQLILETWKHCCLSKLMSVYDACSPKVRTLVFVTLIKHSPCGTKDVWEESENFYRIDHLASTAL